MYTLYVTDSDSGATDKNFHYLLGFQPSFGVMLLKGKALTVLLDGRYFEKTSNISKKAIRDKMSNKNLEVNFVELKSPMIKNIAKHLPEGEKICFSKKVSFGMCESLKKEPRGKKLEIILLEKDTIEEKRLTKSKSERENMQKAIKVIDNVYLSIEEMHKDGKLIGRTEKDLRTYIITKIFEYGGDGESFEAIVAFGKNSACPHHTAGETIIGEGVLLIDMGALYNGYCSDFTRTFWVTGKKGIVSKELIEQKKKFEHVYSVVKEAHENAYQKTKCTYTAGEVDQFARDIIIQRGYEEFFTHATGHGIGLDVHEKPHVTGTSDEHIKEGMFFTIEPGVYLPGEFGIRIEDIVYAQNGKLIKFTSVKI